MSRPAPHHHYSYGDYLSVEETSNARHEYFDGEIYAMAGGTPDHAALAGGVIGVLHAQLQGGPCRVFSSDLRVRVLATGLATYPDATVVCGPLVTDAEDRMAVTNPKLVVEVTSDGTEEYDRGEKLEHYQRIPSLAAIVLVSHRRARVEVWQRLADGGWASSGAGPGEVAAMPAVGCHLDVDAVYRALPAASA